MTGTKIIYKNVDISVRICAYMYVPIMRMKRDIDTCILYMHIKIEITWQDMKMEE